MAKHETIIQSAILQILAMCRIFAWRQNSGAADIEKHTKSRGFRKYHVTFSFPGVSDIIAFYRGRVWFLEVKTPRGKQNENQKRFQSICEENGIDYHVVRSPEDALEVLDGMTGRDKALDRLAAYHEQAVKEWETNGRPEGGKQHEEWAGIIRAMLPDKKAPRPILRGKKT